MTWQNATIEGNRLRIMWYTRMMEEVQIILETEHMMEVLQSIINGFFQFKAYVMLPIIILILSLIIGMKIGKALMSALKLAAGFAGIFIAFDFFVQTINPAVQSLVSVRGLDFPILMSVGLRWRRSPGPLPSPTSPYR